MQKGKFIWADLSTYNTETSIPFYQNVFGWDLRNVQEYNLASLNNKAIAGLFETPDFLKKINMPHFWMSYFQVESTSKTVELAKKLNAKIEVDTTNFYNGKIALIRDPQGAGFTVYDGSDLYFESSMDFGTFIATELHVSDIGKVIPFYSSLFSWELTKQSFNTYVVSSQNALNNISIKKFDNSIKGKYEYWATTILVNELQNTTQSILLHGGSLISQEGHKNLMTDNSGEAFFYIQQL